MLCNSKTKNLIYSEQLFGIRLEVKVIGNWAINCIKIHMAILLTVVQFIHFINHIF